MRTDRTSTAEQRLCTLAARETLWVEDAVRRVLTHCGADSRTSDAGRRGMRRRLAAARPPDAVRVAVRAVGIIVGVGVQRV
jgi:hypothetical protein